MTPVEREAYERRRTATRAAAERTGTTSSRIAPGSQAQGGVLPHERPSFDLGESSEQSGSARAVPAADRSTN